jgi:hypothetical protein
LGIKVPTEIVVADPVSATVVALAAMEPDETATCCPLWLPSMTPAETTIATPTRAIVRPLTAETEPCPTVMDWPLI